MTTVNHLTHIIHKKYLITMVTNVNAYFWTVMFVCLQDYPKDKVVSANRKGLSHSD